MKSGVNSVDRTLPDPVGRHDRCGLWDYDAATQAVSDLLVALGRDARSEHLAETPRRVAEAFAELLTPNHST